MDQIGLNNFSTSLATLGFPSAVPSMGGFDQNLLASLNFSNQQIVPMGGGFQPMSVGIQPNTSIDRFRPYGAASGGGCYGQSKGGGKGKGKGYKGGTKPPPKEEKLVNEKQLIPTKGIYDGGINFKNILQEKVAKQLHRPIGPGDITYTVAKVRGGRQCTLAMPCMGADTTFTPEEGTGDDKHQGQKAAANALEVLFPDSYRGYVEAHGAGIGCGGNTNPPNPSASSGGEPGTPTAGEPKGQLTRMVQILAGRPLAPGDIAYETQWVGELQSFVATVKIPCVDLGFGPLTCESIAEKVDKKGAEKSAAQVCLELYETEFKDAAEAHKAKYKHAGKGGGGGRGRGKGTFGRGWNGGKARDPHHSPNLPAPAPVGMIG